MRGSPTARTTHTGAYCSDGIYYAWEALPGLLAHLVGAAT